MHGGLSRLEYGWISRNGLLQRHGRFGHIQDERSKSDKWLGRFWLERAFCSVLERLETEMSPCENNVLRSASGFLSFILKWDL